MSVTAAAGFRAAGVSAGVKATGAKDVAVVVNDGPGASAAVVFTSNRCVANPVIWSREVMVDGTASAVVLNSGGANCYTGEFGYETSRMTAETAAHALGLHPRDVIVCSTGLIGSGDERFRNAVIAGTNAAIDALGSNEASSRNAAEAILTTDTVTKEAIRRHPDGWRIGAMAKGAGMLAPGLATMLVVITTDADLEHPELDQALREACRTTFNRLDSDGCMSTNDTVALLASGASGIEPNVNDFTELLRDLCSDLAHQLQADAEGAHHNVAITARGAATQQEAEDVARAISRSNLMMTAIFGNDPNWGRVLAAAGTANAQFDPSVLDVIINGRMVCRGGTPHEAPETVDMSARDVEIIIDLHEGEHEATILTNDLTHDYVHENSAYSS